MSKEEWILLRAGWLSRRIEEFVFDIETWEVREGHQVADNEYEFYDAEYRPLKKGDYIFTPDGTSFIRATTNIPKEFEGKEVMLKLQTAAEMMVKVNGKWAGGLDPNRERVLISSSAKAGEKISIEIEGYNRSKPDDERNIKTEMMRGCRQSFTGGSLIVVNNEIEAAGYDVNILLEAMNSESVNEDAREHIKIHLHEALSLVDYEEEDEELYLESIVKLREYIKENIFENKTFKGNGKVALVAHSHLDIAYYWRRINTIHKNARTCLIQLRLMDKYPEFKYCHTQAFTYETLEKHYPEIFEEVKEKIKSGSFEIAGAMYVEPDCNIPTAEALVRQCLYGQHYYRSRFGLTVENCWLPDVFGNSWVLPQILKKSGVKYFVSNKMSTWNDTNRFPHNHFIWKGIDGSDIYACVPPTHFISWNTPEQVIENWESLQDKEACGETMNMFGYGDGGSGATEEMIEYMKRLSKVPGVPEVRHVRGDEFLKENLEGNKKLETWDGELYLEMHRGTFTTKGILKKMNRRLELLLRDVEMICSIASLEGFEYPHETIREAWKKLMINQFHDILPGTHIPPVTTDALVDYKELEESISAVLEAAVQYLEVGSMLKNKAVNKEDSLALINTLSWKQEGLVFVKGDFNEATTFKGFEAQAGTNSSEKGLWVNLDNIPAAGVKTFALDNKKEADMAWFNLEGDKLETPYYKVNFNADGSFASLINKVDGREVVEKAGSFNKVKVYRDNPGMYDAWDILENYSEREDEYQIESSLKLESAGDVFVSFVVEYKLKCSKWKQIIRFYKNSARIDFENKVDWQETNRMAKVSFDLNVLSRYAKCDISAGTITRDTHKNTTWQKARFEVCHHKWADISETDFGVAILNDSKYGISFDKNSFELTLLRSPVRPDINCDKGEHVFTYAILPHEGGLPEEAGIIEEAWKFNSPLRVFTSQEHINTSWMELKGSNLHLQAVKVPEISGEENTLIVRFVELKGKRGKGSFKLYKDIINAVKVNLLEDEEQEVDYSLEDGALHFDYKPFEIVSFKIKLK
jgi:alpha-mannosidase